ncbi:hypothetical protein [Diplocloster hominis]|uniref:hypothetical protein n=1 Tax=Diplocloster hominis TaxID=3079010 RepID=UPI0031BAD498
MLRISDRLRRRAVKKGAGSISIIGGADGPTSVFVAGTVKSKKKADKKNQEQERRVQEIIEQIVPGKRNMEEVCEYLITELGAQESELTRGRRECMKFNILCRYFPEILPPMPEIKGRHTQARAKQWAEECRIRHEKIQDYPEESLDLDMHLFELPLVVKGERIGCFYVELERNTGYLSCSWNYDIGDRKTEQRDIKEAGDRLMTGIMRFRGLAQEDIDNRTQDFWSYISMEQYVKEQ